MLVGRYRILGLLGRGGMGAVYKAAMPVTGRMVALKVCRPAEIMEDLLGMDKVRDMFLREAVTMARVEHPHVAAILDVDAGDESTPPHFSMEYYCDNLGVVMGENYEVEKPSRRLGVELSLHVARQMVLGLDRLHYEGIVHRDVKPFNVMLAGDPDTLPQVKLIDFGLSRLRGETPPGHKGMVVGSPYYTAPEQEADPDSADRRADLFSVAVTLYRMLTGVLPAENEADRRCVSQDHPDLGPEWDEFFATGLARDREKRFADGTAMIDALDGLAEAWRESRDAVCSADLLLEDEPPARSGPVRADPLKVPFKAGRKTFGLDELWHPLAHAPGQFADLGNGTVRDASAGLVWEKHGSRYPLTWERAGAHVARLNKNGYGGRTDWRLPTVAELTTLFTGATEPGAFCLEPVFDPTKARLWSADRKAFNAAWYADAELGFVWWQDKTCRYYARAVCSG